MYDILSHIYGIAPNRVSILSDTAPPIQSQINTESITCYRTIDTHLEGDIIYCFDSRDDANNTTVIESLNQKLLHTLATITLHNTTVHMLTIEKTLPYSMNHEGVVLHFTNSAIPFTDNIYIHISKTRLIALYEYITGKKVSFVLNKNNITDILQKYSDIYFHDSRLFPWKLESFFNTLSNKNIQYCINTLLKTNYIEETMLAALIVSFENDPHRILMNCSKTIQHDIQQSINSSPPKKRWQRIVRYLVKTALMELLKTKQLDFPVYDRYIRWSQMIEHEEHMRIFAGKPFDEWIRTADKQGVLHTVLLQIPRLNILRAAAYEAKTLSSLIRNYPRRLHDEIHADIEHIKNTITPLESMNAQYAIVKLLREYEIPKRKEYHSFLKYAIMNMPKKRYLHAVEETGVLEFARACYNQSTRLKHEAVKTITGSAALLLEDIFTGTIRFKKGFGRTAIDAAQQHFFTTCCLMYFEGRLIAEEINEDMFLK